MDRITLGLVWRYNMQGVDPVQAMSYTLHADEIKTRLDSLTRAGLVDGNMRLTARGRGALTVVMCGGVFDVIHHGHIHMLNGARALGDVLCVVVASDRTAKSAKKKIHHDACTRRRIVDAIGIVDVCLVGHDSDIFESVRAVRPDVIALGYDQKHQLDAGCRRIGLQPKIVRLESSMPDVTSSKLKDGLDVL